MFTLIVLATSALASLTVHAHEGDCIEALASSPLNQRQYQAVRQAAAEGHEFRLLTKKVGRHTRTVLLVGESLEKSAAVKDFDRQLGRAFTNLAHGGDAKLGLSWFPKLFEAYAARQKAREATTDFVSLRQIAEQDEAVRRYEDEVVAKFVALVEAKKITAAIVPKAIRTIQPKGALAAFDHQDVIRRISRNEVDRAPLRTMNLEADYRPTARHNLAMLHVVASEKLAMVSGKIQRALSLLAVAGAATWMAITKGADGKALTLAAASIYATQIVIDRGLEEPTRRFYGTVPRSEHIAAQLATAAEQSDEVILMVLPLSQTLDVARGLFVRGFKEMVALPFVDTKD